MEKISVLVEVYSYGESKVDSLFMGMLVVTMPAPFDAIDVYNKVVDQVTVENLSIKYSVIS